MTELGMKALLEENSNRNSLLEILVNSHNDRLFCVRAQQLYSKMKMNTRQSTDSKLPKFEDQISIGDFCVFRIRNGWRTGKVVQLANYKEWLKKRT